MRPVRHASATGIRLLTAIRRHPLSREGGVLQDAATTSERWSPESRNTLPVCAPPVTSTATGEQILSRGRQEILFDP